MSKWIQITSLKYFRTKNFKSIKSILGNRPLYEGMYKYGNMNWVKGVHEPILKGAGDE